MGDDVGGGGLRPSVPFHPSCTFSVYRALLIFVVSASSSRDSRPSGGDIPASSYMSFTSDGRSPALIDSR